MSDHAAQYDHIGSKYDDYSRSATLKLAERYSVSRMVGVLNGQRVLDLACGLGFYTRLVKQLGAGEVMGVDISPEMIRVATQQEQSEPLGITYQACDALELPSLGPFDLITAVWLLNNAKSKEEMLQMFRKTCDNLTKDGRFVVYTLNPAHDFRKSDFRKYGVRITSETPEQDRFICYGEFLTDPPTPVTGYRWSQPIYEWAIKEVGFREFTWCPSEVSPEDVKRYGQEYWQDFYDNCIGIGLVCKK